jgi:hypothetical protein
MTVSVGYSFQLLDETLRFPTIFATEFHKTALAKILFSQAARFSPDAD